MRRPKLIDLEDTKEGESFEASARQHNKDERKPRSISKSFSLTEEDLSYIHELAMKIAVESRKPVKASAALREIIEFHREQKQ